MRAIRTEALCRVRSEAPEWSELPERHEAPQNKALQTPPDEAGEASMRRDISAAWPLKMRHLKKEASTGATGQGN